MRRPRSFSILNALDTARVGESPVLYQMILNDTSSACARGDLARVIEDVDRLESWGFLKLPTGIDVFTGRPNA